MEERLARLSCPIVVGRKLAGLDLAARMLQPCQKPSASLPVTPARYLVLFKTHLSEVRPGFGKSPTDSEDLGGVNVPRTLWSAVLLVHLESFRVAP